MAAKESFEKTLRRLQEIVEILEQGQSGLDESIQVFEEGLQLVQKCNKQLDSARQRQRQRRTYVQMTRKVRRKKTIRCLKISGPAIRKRSTRKNPQSRSAA